MPHLAFPFVLAATLNEDDEILYGLSNWKALRHCEDSRHRFASTHTGVGEPNHRPNVVCEQHAPLLCGPLQNVSIGCPCKAEILDAGDVETWLTSQQATND